MVTKSKVIMTTVTCILVLAFSGSAPARASDQWSEPKNLSVEECLENFEHGNTINTGYGEDGASVTEDGNTLYFSSNRLNQYDVRDWTIYVSHRDVDRDCWKEPEPLPEPINSSGPSPGHPNPFAEAYPFISPDETILYFNSNRGTGNVSVREWEIWVAERDPDTGTWTGPVRMAEPIYTAIVGDVNSEPSTSYDGNIIYFASNRVETTAGTSDIWQSVKVGDSWMEPQNLGPPISTEYGEGGPSISSNGDALYFHSNRDEVEIECGWATYDVFVSYWEMNENGEWSWTQPAPLSINMECTRDYVPRISWDDAALYFTSNRNGGQGNDDIWVSYSIPLMAEVLIDIKPGSDPNSINLKSKGVVPVAVLTTDEFDAGTVDAATVLFGPAGAEAVHDALEDVDDDGDLDVILHFRTRETGIEDGDTEATLTGETSEGVPITGTDSIRTVPRKR